MKKIKLLILLCSTIIYAQNIKQFGVNLGTNISSFTDDIKTNYKPSIGFVLGAYYEKSMSNKWDLKLNLSYILKTSIENGIFGSDLGSDITHVDYKHMHHLLNLPVLFKYNFGVSQKYFFNFGPTINYLFKKDIRVKKEYVTYIDGSPNQLDLGVSFGFGRKIRINEKDNLSIEIRDDLDLINIWDNSSSRNIFKTNAINLILSWRLK